MKVLFISDFILAAEQGAKQSTRAHLKSLREIFGKDSVDIVSINSKNKVNDEHFVYIGNAPTKFIKLKNIISGSCFFLSKEGENTIVDLCTKEKYSLVFIDHSIYGHLSKRIKEKCGIPIVAYFHGIMAFQTEEYKKNNRTSVFYAIPALNTKYNEKLTVKYTDKCLLLNKRDENNLVRIYGRHADEYLPVYYDDTAKIEKIGQTEKFEMLFVGGYFWPNVHGIRWFVKNVMTRLDSDFHLTIVGNGMDKLNDELSSEKVSVYGRVETLDSFYNIADVVVGPIFMGEGMKTKTCEALMYGKRYIGTDEALEGYEGLDQYRCNSANEFIEKIVEMKRQHNAKYNPEMREIYLKYYSPQMASERLTKLFKDMKII